MTNIAICFPSGENVSVQFTLSLTNMLRSHPELPIGIVANCSSCLVAFNRNNLVNIAKSTNASHILFIDSDTVFQPDALSRLLVHDLPIVGATASKRTDEINNAVGLTLEKEKLRLTTSPILTKMKMLGFPFMLIKMEVFDKMKEPWFAEPPCWMVGRTEEKGLIPEDEYFCTFAVDAGFDIWCDTELSRQIGHRGSKTYYITESQNA